MVKNNKKTKKGSSNAATSSNSNSNQANPSAAAAAAKSAPANNNNNNNNNKSSVASVTVENLDALTWLRDCDLRRNSETSSADEQSFLPLQLQLEYQKDDPLMETLQLFLQQSAATAEIIQDMYQIWQHCVVSTLLTSTALWKKDVVTAADQRQMKDQFKMARYKINFIMHHTVGSMLTSTDPKWVARKMDLIVLCHGTLHLLPRLAESCPHHKTNLRQTIIHFEAKEFLAAVACETWDTVYDYSIPVDPAEFVPLLRRCAMLDILDKDWNMLGGWDDILKGLETKCFPNQTCNRIPTDAILQEQTTILRNARNSMQCKFFSVRFMRYTEDQAPQRWRYFPKCSAPACAHIETPDAPHKYRCSSCWYFHYCSPACQEYCDTIMGLHAKFCKDTPPSKASLCQQETEHYLGWKRMEFLQCHACGVTSKSTTCDSNKSSSSKSSSSSSNNNNVSLKRCQQCRTVCYCSRQCQEWDWRVGGHRKTCLLLSAATTSTAAAAATSTTSSASLHHPAMNGEINALN